MNRAIEEASAALEAYRFDEYAAACYRFTWDTFCDWFVEFAKPVLADADSEAAREVRSTAAHVLGCILRLLHPAMPFVTEELWDRLGYGEPCSLIRTAWPDQVAVPEAAAARDELDWVVRLISEVRSVRTEMNVPPATLTPILLRDAAPETLARGERWMEAIRRLARASELKPLTGEMPKGSAQVVLDEATVILPLAGVIDIASERTRLTRERDKAAGEARKIGQKLDNADFVAVRRARWWRRTASGWPRRRRKSRGWRRRWKGSISCGVAMTSTMLRGADIVMRTLERAGHNTIFTLSGNHIMSLFDAAIDTRHTLVHTRHEAAAVHMADAWGRLTGEPGIAMVTGGPGHANAAAALMTALGQESPLVLLSGHTETTQLGRGGFQELRQAEMAAPAAKASWTATATATLGTDVAKAIRIARSGRPGPVHLSLPSDLLDATVAADDIVWPEPGAFAASPVALARPGGRCHPRHRRHGAAAVPARRAGDGQPERGAICSRASKPRRGFRPRSWKARAASTMPRSVRSPMRSAAPI